MNKSKKGISLIVLVVTIVVIIILVATVLYNITDGKIFGVANESVFKNDLRVIEEEFEMFVQTKATQSVGKFEIESLNAADDGLMYNTKTNEKEKDIYDVIPTAKRGYYGEFEIIKGELYYKGDVEQKLIWAKELGIGIIPYEIVDGVLISANSNLLLLDSTGTVRIPYNVEEIASGVFNNLEGLTRVIIPGSVKEIGANAFSNNTSLQEVIMEDGVEIIGGSSFYGCENLQTVKFSNTLKSIDNSSFYRCHKLNNVNLPQSLSYMGNHVFSFCYSLEKIVIPDGVKNLYTGCFLGSTNLKEITLPANLEKIESNVFANCYGLEKINLNSSNENFIIQDGNLYDKNKETLYFVSSNNVKDLEEYTIEEGVKNVIGGAVARLRKLKVLNLPSSLKTIDFNWIIGNTVERINIAEGNSNYSSDGVNIYEDENTTLVFSISKEKSFTVRQGIKKIERDAFARCTNMESITLNDDLEEIGQEAFNNTKIKEIYIPASVTYLNPIFIYGNSMDKIEIDPQNQNYTSDDKFIYNKNKTKIVRYYKNDSSVVIPDGVEIVDTYGFHNKSNLNQITISSTVIELNQCFQYCTALTSITIPSNVEKISSSCFNNCKNLAQINVDNTQNSIIGAPWGCPYGMRAVNWLK